MADQVPVHSPTAVLFDEVLPSGNQAVDAAQEKLARSAASVAETLQKLQAIVEVLQHNPQLASKLCDDLEGKSEPSSYSTDKISSIQQGNPLPEAERTATNLATLKRGLKESSNQQKQLSSTAEKDAKLPEIHGISDRMQDLQKPDEDNIKSRNQAVKLLDQPNPHPRETRSLRKSLTSLLTSEELPEFLEMLGNNLTLKENHYLGYDLIPQGARLCSRKIMVMTDKGLCPMDILTDAPRGSFVGLVEFELPGTIPATASPAELSQLKQHKNSARREALLAYSYNWLFGPASKLRLELHSKVHSDSNQVDECAKEIEKSCSIYRTQAKSLLDEADKAVRRAEQSFFSYNQKFGQLKELLTECLAEMGTAKDELSECRMEAQGLYHLFVEKLEEYAEKKRRHEVMVIRGKILQEAVEGKAADIHQELSLMMAEAQVVKEDMQQMMDTTLEESEKSCASLRNDRTALARNLEEKSRILQRALELLVEDAVQQVGILEAKEVELQPAVELLTAELDSFEDEELTKELRLKDTELKAVQAQLTQTKLMEDMARALVKQMPPTSAELSMDVDRKARELYTPLKVRAQRSSEALVVVDDSARLKKLNEEASLQEATRALLELKQTLMQA